jgi:hypothetical protein
MVKSPTYNELYQQTLETARAAGVSVIDFWDTPRTDYKIFRDSYHLTPQGAAWVTPLIAEQLKAKMVIPSAVSELD